MMIVEMCCCEFKTLTKSSQRGEERIMGQAKGELWDVLSECVHLWQTLSERTVCRLGLWITESSHSFCVYHNLTAGIYNPTINELAQRKST